MAYDNSDISTLNNNSESEYAPWNHEFANINIDQPDSRKKCEQCK